MNQYCGYYNTLNSLGDARNKKIAEENGHSRSSPLVPPRGFSLRTCKKARAEYDGVRVLECYEGLFGEALGAEVKEVGVWVRCAYLSRANRVQGIQLD